jgi:Flp pilus assembly protein TadD
LALPLEGAVFGLDVGSQTASGDPAGIVVKMVGSARIGDEPGEIAIDYPLEGSVFPPEIVPPTFRFRDPDPENTRWLVHVDLSDGAGGIFVLSDADPARLPQVIDQRVVTNTNTYVPTAKQAAARAWTPEAGLWQLIKERSVDRPSKVTIYGTGERGRLLTTAGTVTISTSSNPVGAPIFYRDVPLMPSENTLGVVNPLDKGALPLIAWRLRDISKPTGPIVMEGMPTCANCHSFSADGGTIGMDMDGPQGDKGAYATAAAETSTVIDDEDVFSWNDYNPDKVTFGLFSRVSPDGRYVVSSVDEEVFVANYLDYRFLQSFYPTGGILAIHDRQTGETRPLPGADDKRYVHCNAVWSPDGETLAFLRAPARPARTPGMELPTYANDPSEPRIRYDIHTIPFNGGRGGEAVPLPGASANGKSNSFPKYSPDGKWLVYVQADNGLLMRPDSKLFIVPATGGTAREMNCNTDRMNSWHSWSPNSRWLVFSSKTNRPYTEMFLTHIDADGNDTPPILVANATADNRAVNLPEFANIEPDGINEILTPAVDYRRLLDRGAALRDEGDLVQAENELRRSLELREDWSETRRIYADVLARQGKVDEAVEAYREVLESEPENAQALNNLGFLLASQDRVDEAVVCYRRSLEIEPDNALANLNLGAILARRGEDEAAVAHLEVAVEQEPDNISAHRILGLVLVRQGHTGLAIPHLERVVAAQPDQENLRRRLALAHIRLGHDEQAITHLEWLAARSPGDATIHKNLGFALDRNGRHEEACRHLETATSLDPGLESAWVNWGVALAKLGRYDEAVAKLKRALEINPDNTSARNNLEKIERSRAGG